MLSNNPPTARREHACLSAVAAIGALQQCAVLLRRLDDRAYSTAGTIAGNGSIGQHVRHSLDHFAAALAGVHGAVINYDRRERGTSIESSTGLALGEIERITGQLSEIDDHAARRRVRIRVVIDASGAEDEHDSTLGRELAFAAHHAVHHHAMIASIADAMGVEVPAGFGKAPATLAHERGA